MEKASCKIGQLVLHSPRKVGCRFTAVLAVEWRGVFNRKWNSKQPLVFYHMFLTRTLCAIKAREIRSRIDRKLELWERGIDTGLVGGALSEVRPREGRVERRKEEENDFLARSFHRCGSSPR